MDRCFVDVLTESLAYFLWTSTENLLNIVYAAELIDEG